MKNIYRDREYVENVVQIVRDNVQELELASIWNDDRANESLAKIKELLNQAEQELDGGLSLFESPEEEYDDQDIQSIIEHQAIRDLRGAFICQTN